MRKATERYSFATVVHALLQTTLRDLNDQVRFHRNFTDNELIRLQRAVAAALMISQDLKNATAEEDLDETHS